MSEIAQLREQIALEMESLRRGLYGVSSGSSRHAFIHARMERIEVCQGALAQHVGPTQACLVVCQLYEAALESDTPTSTETSLSGVTVP